MEDNFIDNGDEFSIFSCDEKMAEKDSEVENNIATFESEDEDSAISIQEESVQEERPDKEKPIIKLDGSTGLIVKKIPAVIKPAMKRASTGIIEPAFKTTKYALQTIASTGSPLTNFQWQKTIGGSGGTSSGIKKEPLGTVISSLPPNTIIQAKGGLIKNIESGTYIQTNGLQVTPTTLTASSLHVNRPTIYIKREMPKRTIRSITIELIEKDPLLNLGVSPTHLPVLKNIICSNVKISFTDCYLTLKKIRQNESFAVLAQYFELTEQEAQRIFATTVTKLARQLRRLVRWPDSKKYYDRHKYLPFQYRAELAHVQSMIECVETEMQIVDNFDCPSYKYVLCIATNNLITYVSEVYFGSNDDLAVFNTSNFKTVIPKYLSLFVVPGKAVRRKRKPPKESHSKKLFHDGTDIDNTNIETDSTTDSAEESTDDVECEYSDVNKSPMSKYLATRIAAEIASLQTLSVENNELVSRNVKDFSIPTISVQEEPVCRSQIRAAIDTMREYKVLRPCAIHEMLLYQYLNEIVAVVAGLINLRI